MKRLMTITLLLAISVPVFAGEIPTNPAPALPPSSTTTLQDGALLLLRAVGIIK